MLVHIFTKVLLALNKIKNKYSDLYSNNILFIIVFCETRYQLLFIDLPDLYLIRPYLQSTSAFSSKDFFQGLEKKQSISPYFLDELEHDRLKPKARENIGCKARIILNNSEFKLKFKFIICANYKNYIGTED